MKTLTSKERLTRLFSRQPIDRIPMWMLFPSRKWHLAADVFDHPSYKELTRVIHDETDHVCRMSFPTRFLLNAHPDVHSSREGKRHTVQYKDKVFVSDTIAHGDHSEVIPLCKSLEDLETLLEFPFEMCQADTSTYAEEVAALGDRGLPCVMVPGPLSMTRAAFSETDFPILYATEPERMRACMDELQRRCVLLYKQLLAQGLGDIYWIDGAEYILPPMLNPKLFPYYATGDYKALVDLVREAGKWSMIHSHGRCGMVLDEFRKIGMDSIHPLEPPPMGDVTLPQAREALGPDCIFVGNIQYSDLFHGCTEEDIEQKTLEIIAESKKGPILLAISASPIVQDLPAYAMRNYMRIIETVQRYGWYA